MTSTARAWAFLKKYQKDVSPVLKQYFTRQLDQAREFGQVPYTALHHFYQLIQKGKKVRGAFLVLGYQLGQGRQEDEAVRVSLFIELLHTALLIHDDIMDQDKVRRGLPASHIFLADYAKKRQHPNPDLFGLSNAITIADTAFYLSWQRLMTADFKPDIKIKAAQIYADYIIRLAYGQMLDVANLYHWHSDKDEILKIFKYKTAEYTGSLPLVLGYTLAGGDDQKIINALRSYGLAFGWIFQIKDDILGIFGNPNQTGKGVGSDLTQSKNTILVWYIKNRAAREYKLQLDKLIGKKSLSRKDLDLARVLFQESGAYNYAKKLADNYLKQGLASIACITQEPKTVKLLKSFLKLAFDRDN